MQFSNKSLSIFCLSLLTQALLTCSQCPNGMISPLPPLIKPSSRPVSPSIRHSVSPGRQLAPKSATQQLFVTIPTPTPHLESPLTGVHSSLSSKTPQQAQKHALEEVETGFSFQPIALSPTTRSESKTSSEYSTVLAIDPLAQSAPASPTPIEVDTNRALLISSYQKWSGLLEPNSSNESKISSGSLFARRRPNTPRLTIQTNGSSASLASSKRDQSIGSAFSSKDDLSTPGSMQIANYTLLQTTPTSSIQNDSASLQEVSLIIAPLSAEQIEQMKEDMIKKNKNRKDHHEKVMAEYEKMMRHRKMVFAGSALAISVATVAAPDLLSNIIARSEGTRFIGASLIAANSVMAALPTLLSVVGGACAMHKIHGWLYGDIKNDIKGLKERILTLENRSELIQGELLQALHNSQAANAMLEQIQPEVQSLQESNRMIAQSVVSILPVIS
jgi:hypothetical protein